MIIKGDLERMAEDFGHAGKSRGHTATAPAQYTLQQVPKYLLCRGHFYRTSNTVSQFEL